MSTPSAEDSVAHLKDALAAGRFSKADRQRAEAVIVRMETPVRVSIIGAPGSGKSMLINLLLGSRALVSADRMPTTRITWGDEARSVITNPDGTQDEFDGFDTADLAGRKPVFVEAQLPLAALKKISVMELVTQGSPKELQNALIWASQRTDIAIWCTQNFDSTEQAIWQSAPDRLKDHAILLRTKADAIGDPTELAHVMSALTHQVADQFKLILPLATLGAIRARRPDGSVDKDRLQVSGGRALIAAVLQEVEQGRRATADQADFLLSKLAVEAPQAPKPKAPAPKAEPSPAPVQAKAEPKPKPPRPTLVRSEGAATVDRTPRPPRAQPMPVNSPDAPAEKPAARLTEPATEASDAPKPAPQRPSAPAPAEDTPAQRIARRACRDAVHQLARQGRSAARALRAEGAVDPERIVADTMASLKDLGAKLDEISDGDSDAFAGLRSSVYDAGDLLQLMQHESGPGNAEETVSLAVQIKREIEARMVA